MNCDTGTGTMATRGARLPLGFRLGLGLWLATLAWHPVCAEAQAPSPAGAREAAEAAALEEAEGLYVIVEATQRPLDGALVLPPACGPYRDICDTVRGVLHNDLHLSGVVRALELPEARVQAIKKYAPPHFEIDRAAAQKDAVVYAVGSWVRRSREVTGAVELRVDVYDVRSGKLLNLGARAIQTGPPSQIRVLAHRASNAIFGALTGVEGSFDSQIFYSAPGKGCDRCIWVADADGYNAKVAIGDPGVHMLPRQVRDGGFSYVSFRTMLPSVFRVDGKLLDRVLPSLPNLVTPPPEVAAATEKNRKAAKKARKKRKGKKKGDQGEEAEDEVVGPAAEKIVSVSLATSDTLQFRTAAQSLRGDVAATINDGDQADIWLLDKAGHPLVNLTKNEADDLDPSWSPDGSMLAFVSDRSGSPQIYVVGADGSGLQRLTFAGRYNTGPDWGPNGQIVYSGLRGSAVDILTVDMNKQMKRLTPGKGRRSLEPSWSPSGRRVVYVSDEDGAGARLWIASHDGAVRHPLALPAGRYYTPAWRRLPGQRPLPFTP